MRGLVVFEHELLVGIVERPPALVPSKANGILDEVLRALVPFLVVPSPSPLKRLAGLTVATLKDFLLG